MPRELLKPEIASFLLRHKEVSDQVKLIDQGGRVSMPLAYPGAGVAVLDSVFSYVLVWRDAGKKWHYIDLKDMPGVAKEINKPAYVSPDASLLKSLAADGIEGLGLDLGGLNETLTGITTFVKWATVGFITIFVIGQLVRFGR